MLTKQVSAIEDTLRLTQDMELKRDADIINLYINRLYECDDKWLSSVKNRVDLTWDIERFESKI